MRAILSGAAVTLTKNYVLTDAWTSLSGSTGRVVIDGANHYIAGLTTSLLADNYSSSSLTVKNLTIKDSTIAYTGTVGAGNGAIVGNMNGHDVTLENCHLNNVTVNNNGTNLQVGGFIGQFDAASLKISDCSVKDCTINANSSAGAIVGMVMANANKTVEISGCSVTGSAINSSDNGDWRIGAILGTVNGTNGTLKITSCTQSGNTFAMFNSSATNPGHALYGRKRGTNVDVIIA